MDRTALVKEFMDKFQASRNPDLWLRLCEEESVELFEALTWFVKEASDLSYVVHGLHIACGENGEETERLLKQTGNVWKVFTIFLRMAPLLDGELFDEAFLEVHQSNMSKLGEDGKPIKREDGKVLRGPNYTPADIDRVILQHYGLS